MTLNGIVALHSVLTLDHSDIDMKDIPAGMYILKVIYANGKEVTCKIIKL